MTNLCIYHDHCDDGFASATIVKMLFSDNIEFYPANYQEPPPNVKDKDVYIVDFSYKRDVLLSMAKEAKSITILDHHVTAQEDLKNLPNNVNTVFDMEQSGAVITWRYCFPNVAVPLFLQYIQDRDLWRFELENTKAVSAGLKLMDRDFDLWSKYIRDPDETQKLIEKGSIILEYQQTIIDGIKRNPQPRIDLDGHNVPCINTTTLISEIGSELALTEPFVAMYFETDTHRVFSLRSNKENGVNVAEIAKKFGGGGHKNAAGFKILKPAIELIPLN